VGVDAGWYADDLHLVGSEDAHRLIGTTSKPEDSDDLVVRHGDLGNWKLDIGN
jgi:hypothetical protein